MIKHLGQKFWIGPGLASGHSSQGVLPDGAQEVSEDDYRGHIRATEEQREVRLAAMRAAHPVPPLVISRQHLIHPSSTLADHEAQIASARAKLDWARNRLQLVEDHIKAYKASDPVTVVVEVNIDGHASAEVCYRLEVEALNGEVAGLVGNVLSDLRAALDHVHKALVLPIARVNEYGESFPKSEYFPIPAGWKPSNQKWLKTIESACLGDVDLVDVIKNLFGCPSLDDNDWRGHCAKKLTSLVNPDKHQRVVVISPMSRAKLLSSLVAMVGLRWWPSKVLALGGSFVAG